MAANSSPSAFEKEQIFGMAEKEMEYRVELFNKYKESELNMGENSCIDRCVSKYWQVNNLIGQLLGSGRPPIREQNPIPDLPAMNKCFLLFFPYSTHPHFIFESVFHSEFRKEKQVILRRRRSKMGMVVVISLPLIIFCFLLGFGCYFFGRARGRREMQSNPQVYGMPAPPPGVSPVKPENTHNV
ncbi:hypothetical protein V8G54_036238 [Vigna mungo]|uniref:Tim10-like domain-containing protein n=1 Tax=Vigna mungo TaxID=3915 RepID=A0AAQ3MGT0_VIGMU